MKPLGHPIETHLHQYAHIRHNDKKEDPVGRAHELPHSLNDDYMDKEYLIGIDAEKMDDRLHKSQRKHFYA